MASKEFEQLIEFLKSIPETKGLTFKDRRTDFEERSKQLPVMDGTQCIPIALKNLKAEWVIPPEISCSSVILYIHGGGYCVGSINTHRSFASMISSASKTKMLLIDYRLAPEHPFPAAIHDTTFAYKWLLSQGKKKNDILIAGDSAGGGITVSALLNLKQGGYPLPAAAICMSPWVDLEMTGGSHQIKASLDILLQKDVLEEMVEAYVGTANPGDPHISPIHADLSGLPPMLIQVGTSEVLLDDARQLAQNAEKAGVDVTLDVWEDMIHIFQYFAFMIPEGRAAIDNIAAFVQKHTQGCKKKA